MSDTPKLYHATTSPNSRRVRIFPAEKGITPTLIPVHLGAGEQHSDAYRAINPLRVVPALVLEDGTTIGEVLAIMRYLDEAFPETPLLGATPKDKGLVVMWERFAELEGFATVMVGVHNKAERLVGRAIAGPHGYDHFFIIKGKAGTLRLGARAEDPMSGRVLEMLTTQPGVQLYTANSPIDFPGKGGVHYVPHTAFCLETQHSNNSPNISTFPSTELKPGQHFHEVTIFRFATVK